MVTAAPLGPLEFRIQNGRVKVFHTETAPHDPVAELVLDFAIPDRPPEPFDAVRFEVADNGFDLHAELWDVICLDVHLEPRSEPEGIAMRLRLINPAEDLCCRVAVGLRKLAGDCPRWMIPGIFYKHNRVEKCRRIYPAYSSGTPVPEKMVSNAWSFRSDRAASPAVFVWTNRLGAYVLTDERVGVTDQNRLGLGMTGLYFRADQGQPEIGMLLPYTEQPVQYSYCNPERTAPVETWVEIGKSYKVEWEVFFGIGAPDLHSYDNVLRANACRIASANPIRPWMQGEEAETLVTQGLLNWHSNPEKGVIYETAAFEKYFGGMGGHVDRPAMHSGWVGGAPLAHAMLLRGHDTQDATLIDTATAVLNHVAEGVSLTGAFWPEWREEGEWSTGWNPDETWVQARTLADTTLYMLRALRLEVQKGKTHPDWLRAIQSNLDFAVGAQREDGNLGACYSAETGEVVEWEGCAGLAWISALAAGSSLFFDSRYREAARKAGAYYAKFIEDEFLYGAAEDQFLTPTVEDGYCAVGAYLLLYELDRNDRWLKLARRAADWALTFRFTYNVKFPKTCLLGMYEYRTRGADANSPANHALHSYALWGYPEMLKLSTFTDDPYYRDRAEEQRIACLQMIAREDGDFAARKGMIPGQIYQTDWWQPKGRALELSHAWCLGAVLYANVMSRLASTPPDVEHREEKKPADEKTKPPEEHAPIVRPLDRPWAATDPRDTQEIPIKWKIF